MYSFKKVFLVLLMLCAAVYAQAQIISNFNSDDEGWTVRDTGGGNAHTVTYNATGGNPGGYISTAISLSTSMYWRAPAKFLGANCQKSYGANLRFDLQLAAPGNISGASAVYGNVRISCAFGYSIVMDLPGPPAVTPGWTSYAVKLDETTAWRKANLTGPLATRQEIIDALSNITLLEIVAQAAFGSDPEVNLDNVVLEQNPLSGTPPSITSFTPKSGVPGTTNVTITGNNFNTTAANNIVYFGSVKASASSATATQLVVQVPHGALYTGITVVNKANGLSATTRESFTPGFDNNKDFGGQIIPATMGPRQLFDLDAPGGATAVGDIDGDGLNDIVIGETGGASSLHQFSVLRNTGQTGSISSTSFAAKITKVLTLPYVKGFLALADYDGDGMLDVAISSASASTAYVTVLRNTSTPGNISFGSEQNYMGYSYSDGPLAAADMDGDGRPEILSIFNNNCGTGDRLYIYPNISTPGNIDFCGLKSYGNVYTCGGYLTTGDLDGDKLSDVVVTVTGVSTIFKNTSTPGSITLATPFVINLSTNNGGNAVIADFDNDGKNDLAWAGAGFANSLVVKRNNYTTGTFDGTSFSGELIFDSPLSQEILTTGDINGDGKVDVIGAGISDMTIFQNVSTGTLNASSFISGVPYEGVAASNYLRHPVAGDFDGDDKQEICLRSTNSIYKLAIYHNESFPAPRIDTITPATGSAGTAVTFTGDYFRTDNASLQTRLAGTKITSSTTSNTAATTTVTAETISGRFNVTEHGLTAVSKPFTHTFATNQTIDATSFPASIDFALGTNVRDALEVADFDDDGKTDVAAIESFGVTRIFRNTHATPGQPITASSLTLESTTWSGGYNLIALDIDGDGKIDMNNGYGLNRNNSTPGNISFLNGSTGAYTYASGFIYAAAADFNKDGKLDLAYGAGGANISINENLSSTAPFVNNNYLSTYDISVVNLPKPNNYGGIAAVDFDGDGYDDIISTNPFGNSYTVYLNTRLYGDIAVSSFLLIGTSATTGLEPNNLTAADFDGDGKTDIAITYFNSAFVSVLLNQSTVGSISFATAVDLPCNNKGYSIASQDLDGDGKAEIIVIHQPNPGPGSFTVFKNNSTAATLNFAAAVNYPITRNAQALNIADINHDEKPDILITASHGTLGNAVMVFENKIASGPVISITSQPTFTYACEGSTATFTVDASGATNIIYKWQKYDGSDFTDINDGGGYSGTSTKVLSINTSVTGFAGNGEYRARINGDLATEVFSDDPQLTINSLPSPPDVTGDSECTTPASLTLTATGASDGDYNWYDSPSSSAVLETDGTFITPSITTTTTYYVSIEDTFCESDRVPVVATIAPLTKPNINSTEPVVGGTVNLCDGESTTLTAPNGFASYAWSNGALTQQITVNTPQVVTVTVTDASPCTSPASDPVTVEVNPYPAADITVNGSQLTASAGDSYQWFQSAEAISGATGQSFDFNVLEYGIYTVDVTDNGCTTTSDEFIYLITQTESSEKSWRVHPNPFSRELIIETPSLKNIQIKISDVLGRIVDNQFTDTNTPLNLESLSEGHYILTVHTGKQKLHFRIIKTR